LLVYLFIVEPATGASMMSKALEMLQPQSALMMLHVAQQPHDVTIDLSLDWDPLSAYTDIMAESLHNDCISAGLFVCIHYHNLW